MVLRIAVPKGHLEESTVSILKASGIGVMGRNERQLFARTNDPEIELVFVRAEDIPNFVANGSTDLGITGYDLVCESGDDVLELLDLRYGYTRMVVAASEKSGIKNVQNIKPGTRVATEFPKIAKKYFSQKGTKVELVDITGAAEISPLIGVADLIVDVTSTGSTLKAHGLRIVDVILESTARLIANRRSLEEKGEKIRKVTTALSSVVMARGKKLILMNVPENKLEEVKMILPGMAGPTVSRVESAEPMMALQAVVEERDTFEVTRKAKEAGARDILVVPIERIIP